MRELYRKARNNIEKEGGLQKENIIDIVNTILKRKRLKLSLCQVVGDWFLSIFPYKSLRKLPLSTAVLERRRLFSKASSMLRT